MPTTSHLLLLLGSSLPSGPGLQPTIDAISAATATSSAILRPAMFHAKDDLQPKQLATCELSSRTAADAALSILRSSSSAIEWRLYDALTSSSVHDFETTHTAVVLLVGMQPPYSDSPQPEGKEGQEPILDEAEFHRWYDEEHTPLFARVPGWRRTARYVLRASSMDRARFLALHEWMGEEAFESEEFRHATGTKWRNEIVRRVDGKTRERRVFAAGRM
jgi:hypothetical protein